MMTSVMRWAKWGVVICLVVQTVTGAATAEEIAALPGAILVISWTKHSGTGLSEARRRESDRHQRFAAMQMITQTGTGLEHSPIAASAR